MPHLMIGSRPLHYEDDGDEEGSRDKTPVVFCHAYAMSGAMFAPQRAAFGEMYRCITWDSRGHGASLADGPFDLWDCARDALALLDHLGIDEAIFVGASQGGMISLRAALLAPARIRAMAVLGCSATTEPPDQHAAYMAMHDAFLACISGNGPGDAAKEILDIQAQICFGPHFDAELHKRRWAAWPAEQFTLALTALVERDCIKERLREIAAPTLVLHGSADGAYAPVHGEIIATGVAHAEGFILIEDGAHFLSLTDPDPVNAALGAFLRKFR